MIDKALLALRPGAQWAVNGDTYAGIIWLDEVQTLPTEQEVQDKIQELLQEQEANAYKELRKAAYPPIGDQLDALWKGGQDAADMLATIQAVKSQYPKPE